jgi:hypothetical protein
LEKKTNNSVIKEKEKDEVTLQVRDKAYHIFGSTWLGELHLKVKDFADGHVHEKVAKEIERKKKSKILIQELFFSPSTDF